ncbi:DUF1772 domain-containing protein [Nostoc sp. LEGE 12450]|uniref:anthrone oxygenase family protein n=1 Tax=Nostoc sp. LEGE 12450 TaxID=1828643 RepID=UPI001D143AC1|nr:DUF1772 domain-containing protein [Nostoc sp. LEGE 12450]
MKNKSRPGRTGLHTHFFGDAMLQHLINQQYYFALKLFSVLGCGLIAGVFFGFSTFVMSALARLKPPQGIAAMQSINITVINPFFMTAFLGTAVACIFLLISSLLKWHQPGAAYLLLGSLLYLVGTLGVTIVFNVPLNEALAKVEPDSTEGVSLWSSYLTNWTIWNHIRTVAALAAAASLTIALCLGSRIVGGLDNTVR